MVTATINVRDEGPAAVESVTVDSRPVTSTAVVVIDTAALPDGLHEIMAEVRDMSRQRNAARASAMLRTENSPPDVKIVLDPPVVPQGQTLVIRLAASKPASMTASLDGGPLLLAVVSDTLQWGIVGIGANARLLTHTLVLTAADRLGNRGVHTSTFGVVATAFISENIVLPPDRQGLSNSAEETRRLDAAFAARSSLPLWQGLWRVPAEGEVTAPFGEARSYNGGPLASWHGGVDLAAAAGAPVGAAAAGRVVLADKFTGAGQHRCRGPRHGADERLLPHGQPGGQGGRPGQAGPDGGHRRQHRPLHGTPSALGDARPGRAGGSLAVDASARCRDGLPA